MLATMNRLVRDKPGIAAASLVCPFGVGPTFDIALVRIRNPDAQTVNWSVSALGEMENEFVTISNKSVGPNRLKMAG